MRQNMNHVFRIYLKTLIIFLAVDAVWLIFVSPPFYKAHIGHLLADSPNLLAALLFYLIFIAGLVQFAILPSVNDQGFRRPFSRGAFFGLVTYATFDLTSQAVFRDWPTVVTIVDLSWGAFISGVTTVASTRRFTR